MDRHAQKPASTPDRSVQRFHPDQREAYEGLLLALLARKRFLVLTDSVSARRGAVLAGLIEQVAADGSLVLPVVARQGMQVEDLLAVSATRFDAENFDAFIEAVEEQLDLAGSGLLAVNEAHRLTPATLVDLADLSRSESGGGRCVQSLLSGAPELEHTLARAGLERFIRDAGVIYRLSGDAAGAALQDDGEPLVTSPGVESSQNVPHPMRPRRRAAVGWVAVFILIAMGGVTALAVQKLNPDLDIRALNIRSFEAYAARVSADARKIWVRVESGVRAWSQETFGWPRDDDALAFHDSRKPMESPTESPLAALPEPDHAPAERGPLPPLFTAPPPVIPPSVVLPPPPPALTPPVAVSIAVAPLPEPSAPSETPTLPSLMESTPVTARPPIPPLSEPMAGQRVDGLVELAHRQIRTRRLTTPLGDNAYETVRRIRALAPASPEIPALLTAITDIYRRWATQAEADGDVDEARRYYERALMVNPDDPALRAQIRAIEERGRRAETSPPSPLFGPPLSGPPPAAPARGFTDQETTRALLHHTPSLVAALAAGQNPNQRLENGKTPLMLAAEAGLRDAARPLLDRGANPNLRTGDGATAMMYAAWNGREDMIALLADAGADVNAGNDDGKTALMAAAARGHTGVVQALLARGVMVDRVAAHGWTALMYAAHAGNEPVVRMLMDAGADPNRTDPLGNSAVSLGHQQSHVLSALLGR